MVGDFWVLMPIVCLTIGAFLVYLLARVARLSNQALSFCTALSFLAAFGSLIHLAARSELLSVGDPAFRSLWVGATLFRAEPGALFVSAIALGLGICVVVYSGRYISLDQRYHTYYPLLLLVATGIIGMVTVTDLFGIYLFCELMSVAAYVLVAFRRETATAIEAGFKYLILSSVATLVMLLGIAWIYREAGSVTLPLMSSPGLWMRAGTGCFLVGLALKSGIVPLHTWLPDAYGRAPSSVSAFLAGIGSKSTIYVILQVGLGLGVRAGDLGLMLIWLSFLNMTLGNLLALVQQNTKRLLAYSSIAQAGYIMFALGVGLRYNHPAAIRAGLLLLLGHAVMKGLAFLSKGVCHFYLKATLVDELQGTFQRLPLIGLTFSFALLGLAGFPPLAGFAAKWFILAEALLAAETLVYFGAIVFLLNTLVSLGYYLPLIARIFTPASTEVAVSPIRISRWMTVPVLALSLLVMAIGAAPDPWLGWVTDVMHIWGG